MLVINHLSFSFNPERKILDNISMSLQQSKIYALMGANGSGKTTLFNIITGFIRQETGEILIDSNNISNLSPFKRNRLGICRTFQDLRLIENLTVEENIELAYINRLSDTWYRNLMPSKSVKQQNENFKIKTKSILEQFHLTEVKSNLANEISYGQQKLLSLACCVANDAQLLLLDEPVAGVNPVYREQLTEILLRLKQQGKIILLIEHNTDFINQVADSIYFMAYGQKHNFKNIAEMKQSEIVLNAYL